MEIRQELELCEDERGGKIGSVTRLKTNKSSKSISSSFKEEKNRLDEAQTNKSSKSIDRLFKEEKSRLDQVNLAQQINMNSLNENTAATMTYQIPKRAIPFAFGEKLYHWDMAIGQIIRCKPMLQQECMTLELMKSDCA